MDIPDDIKNCVCFICGKNQDGSYHYGGTGFFVSVRSEQHQDQNYAYLVTAKHNIEKAKAERYYDLYLRLNTTRGDADFIQVTDEWLYHEDEAVDVAVLPFDTAPKPFRIVCVPPGMLATDEVIEAKGVGLGDELAVVGLFTSRRGNKKNIPIVRSGIISAMPEEPLIDSRSGLPYDAYLAEIRSIGGLSGSPVFVFKWSIDHYTDNLRIPIGTTKLYILGLIHGHWDLEQFVSSTDFASKTTEQFNAGIAIVTPIKSALDIIYGEELMKDRRKMDRLKDQEDAPTLDSGFNEQQGKATEQSAFTKAQFEGALKKVSRKVSQPESEKNETSE
jgi:hypothetical protein